MYDLEAKLEWFPIEESIHRLSGWVRGQCFRFSPGAVKGFEIALGRLDVGVILHPAFDRPWPMGFEAQRVGRGIELC